MLIIVANYHCIRFQGKVMNEKAENLVSDAILAHSGLNLVPQNIFVGSTSTKCYALLQAIIVFNFKEK